MVLVWGPSESCQFVTGTVGVGPVSLSLVVDSGTLHVCLWGQFGLPHSTGAPRQSVASMAAEGFKYQCSSEQGRMETLFVT